MTSEERTSPKHKGGQFLWSTEEKLLYEEIRYRMIADEFVADALSLPATPEE